MAQFACLSASGCKTKDMLCLLSNAPFSIHICRKHDNGDCEEACSICTSCKTGSHRSARICRAISKQYIVQCEVTAAMVPMLHLALDLHNSSLIF